MNTTRILPLAAAFLLAACNAIQYQPLATIKTVNPQTGYRLSHNMAAKQNDQTFVLLTLSGGGTRAAAFGYGVLEELKRHPVPIEGRLTDLVENIDVVYGVSGGSVLATYLSLHGAETIPTFERRFLKQNFQKLVIKQSMSLANMPRMLSPEFGRGDMLQEQLENTLFGKTTFGDLARRRKGPFTVINATDMSAGKRIDFTQEFFDILCLDLSKLRIARAVAASSAVPLVFSPLTLNNNGGNCGYTIPSELKHTVGQNERLQRYSRQEFVRQLASYADRKNRPYLHLLDGGLTDNLGLRNLLETQEIYSHTTLRERILGGNGSKIVIISVNAQNKISSNIDRSAVVPGFADQLAATIDIPIDQNTEESLRRFRAAVDYWNSEAEKSGRRRTAIYFVNLNLRDLPESELKHHVLNIPTTFYLPPSDINALKSAAAILLNQSEEFKRLKADLNRPEPAAEASAPAAASDPQPAVQPI